MRHCELCGEPIPDNQQYCDLCSAYLQEAYEQMERDERYAEEMRRDAFGDQR